MILRCILYICSAQRLVHDTILACPPCSFALLIIVSTTSSLAFWPTPPGSFMKRGFLLSEKAKKEKPVAQSLAGSIPENVSVEIVKNTRDTTRVYSRDPLIVCFDVRFEDSPHFLYLPPGKADPDMVFIDRLDSVKKIAQWDLWKVDERSTIMTPDVLPFRIAEISDKGMGMFAERLIKAGELVMAERPIFCTRGGLHIDLDQSTNGIFPRAAISRLSDEARGRIMALRNCFSDRDIVSGILSTNFLQIDITEEPDPAETFSGCFSTLSRANHSCSPNVNYFFSFKTFAGQFWATRDIAKDEEITLAYTYLMTDRSTRRAALMQGYRFTCTCQTCSLPPHLSKISDERRRALGALDPHINTQAIASRTDMQHMRKLMGYAGEEGLAVMYARLVMNGISLLIAERKWSEAHAWAKKARRAFKTVEGEGSYNVRVMEDCMRTMGALK